MDVDTVSIVVNECRRRRRRPCLWCFAPLACFRRSNPIGVPTVQSMYMSVYWVEMRMSYTFGLLSTGQQIEFWTKCNDPTAVMAPASQNQYPQSVHREFPIETAVDPLSFSSRVACILNWPHNFELPRHLNIPPPLPPLLPLELLSWFCLPFLRLDRNSACL